MRPPRRRRTRWRVDSYVTVNIAIQATSQWKVCSMCCHGGGVEGAIEQGPVGMTDLLDVVVGEGAAILELLAGEDQALLVRRDALLVLDLGLDVVDGVRGLDLQGDGLARQGLHEAAWVSVIAGLVCSVGRSVVSRGIDPGISGNSHLHCREKSS